MGNLRAKAEAAQAAWDTYDYDVECAKDRARYDDMVNRSGDADDSDFSPWFPPIRKSGPSLTCLSPHRILELLDLIDGLAGLVQRSIPMAGPATEYEAWDRWHKDREALIFKMSEMEL